ncbi:hypothetical protein IU433_03055 [Nocardia puris]|uniref:Trypsin n=1 Tax=Nocardia puris TaxID=208602 RepID=A0A366DVR6_9NOCA|nr:S1 family peptidase [Nocardia puris]MBF6210069.1 hypothetical protein [Nocardia puris]MBF6368260.1 hypothetical protein [Nocardia puris]MBF6458021.1 hypothetical protein [Nocardia puris]RBO94183.1 hypothetical protein DFR74_102606 [Nocardia puris]
MSATRRAAFPVLLFAVPALVVTLLPVRAQAVTPDVPLGGGSGVVFGYRAVCTLTAIGHDREGRLVGLTAGHCTEVGQPVHAEHATHAGVIGTVVARQLADDWAVIEFDAARVAPRREVAGTVITGIGGPPEPGDVVCKNGRTSGHSCGVVWDRHDWWFRNQVCSQPGDSGGPVTVGDRLVGMNVGHIRVDVLGVTVFDIACQHPAVSVHDPAVATHIGRVLDAVDRTGGVGAGFRPL